MLEIFNKEYKFIIFYFLLILIIFITLKILIPPKFKLTYKVDIYPAVTEKTIRELIFDMKKNSINTENEISKKLNKETEIIVRDYAKNYRLFINVTLMYEKRQEIKNNLSYKNEIYKIIDNKIYNAFKKSFIAQKKQFEIENKAFEEDINLLNKKNSELKKKFLDIQQEISTSQERDTDIESIELELEQMRVDLKEAEVLSNYRSKKYNFVLNIVDNELESDVYLINEHTQILDKINFKLLLSLIFASVFLSFLHISIIILKKNNF